MIRSRASWDLGETSPGLDTKLSDKVGMSQKIVMEYGSVKAKLEKMYEKW